MTLSMFKKLVFGFALTFVAAIAHAEVHRTRATMIATHSRRSQESSAASMTGAAKDAAVMYVSPRGSDSNDGASWGTAKATIYGALVALLNGSASSKLAGTGIVYVADGSSANPTSGAGIWLMGRGDPNYSSPPAGWLRANGALRIIGVKCQHFGSNQVQPACLISAGSGRDTNHPAMWFSSFGYAMRFENLLFQYPGQIAKIGINSNGVRQGANQNVTSLSFDNVSGGLNALPGNGPGIDIGDSSFDIWFHNCSPSGNSTYGTAIVAPPGTPGLSRASNVVTVTTKANHRFSTGDNVGITDAADSSFNGSFRNITVTGVNTFTYYQKGPNATSGNGIVINDIAFAVRVEPTTRGIGSGFIYYSGGVTNGSAIRYWLGINGGSIWIDHLYVEGDYIHPISPILWIGGSGAPAHFEVGQTGIADQLKPYSAIIVQNDGGMVGADNVLVTGNSDEGEIVRGPATVSVARSTGQSIQPFKSGQQGILGGHLWAQTDVARSSPQTVRFANLAPTANASWVNLYGGMLTYNVVDRDGGTNAATEASSRGTAAELAFNNHSAATINVGDIFICGVWVRSVTGNGFYAGGNGETCSVADASSLTYSLLSSSNPINRGDGEWEWSWTLFKIGSISGSSPTLLFGSQADTTHTVSAYNPILIRIPSGTVSDNEAYNIANYLRGFLNTCLPGQLCDAVGQVPHVNAQQTWTAAQAFGAISINNETVSAAPRFEQNVFLSGALTSTWIASTWTPEKTVTLTRIQIQAKTAPSGCSTNAVVQVTDGTNAVKLAVTSAANDSGAVSQTYTAGTPLTISVLTAASGCTMAPADANVTLQYRMN